MWIITRNVFIYIYTITFVCSVEPEHGGGGPAGAGVPQTGGRTAIPLPAGCYSPSRLQVSSDPSKASWNLLETFSVLRVLGLKKASIFDLFQKCQNQNLHFWIFSKNSFRNELLTPYLPNTPYVKFSHFIFWL